MKHLDAEKQKSKPQTLVNGETRRGDKERKENDYEYKFRMRSTCSRLGNWSFSRLGISPKPPNH